MSGRADYYIILPDGRLEAVYCPPPADCPVHEIVFPRVYGDLVLQARYETLRLGGLSHEDSVDWLCVPSRHPIDRFAEEVRTFVARENPASPLPTVSADPDRQARYVAMRAAGESHKMAEMLACRSFPGVRSDSIFNEGKFSGTRGGHCAPHELWLRGQAEAKGVSTNGKWYCAGLANFPGDPEAWVGGRGDVERVARERNLTVEGYVTHKGHEVPPKPAVEIDPALVHAEAQEIAVDNPGVRYGDIYEEVHNLRTGKLDNNPLVVQEPTQDWS